MIPSHIFKTYDDGQLSIFREESEKVVPHLFKEQRQGQTFMYYEELLEELGLQLATLVGKPPQFDKYEIFKAVIIQGITVRKEVGVEI